MKDFNVKIRLKHITSHDLEKVLHYFHDQDYYGAEQEIEIETVECEEIL